MKLLLYSLQFTSKHSKALADLVGKKPQEITCGLIENAADVIEGSTGWLGGIRDKIRDFGYQVEVVDLRNWLAGSDGLYEALSKYEVLWIGGGHTYYLRWILRETGADGIISKLVDQGKVYVGWSAGAVVAGPTIEHFDAMGDDPAGAPEVVIDGLDLIKSVVVPHIGNPDFDRGANRTKSHLDAAGFNTIGLSDNQALTIDGINEDLI